MTDSNFDSEDDFQIVSGSASVCIFRNKKYNLIINLNRVSGPELNQMAPLFTISLSNH